MDNLSFIIILFFALWSIITIYGTGKYKIIYHDITNPYFIVPVLFIFGLTYYVRSHKNFESHKTKRALHHAILAAISSYFGHLDLPTAAFFIAGLFVLYAEDDSIVFLG